MPSTSLKNRTTSLLAACKAGDLAAVEEALGPGGVPGVADVNSKDPGGRGQTPLIHAVWGMMSSEEARVASKSIVGRLLRVENLDVNGVDKSNNTALHNACQFGLEDALALLLAHPRINVNARGAGGSTPLMSAALEDKEGCVRLLCADPRVDVEAVDNRCDTALTYATRYNHPTTVSLLTDAIAARSNP
jgi:ankyrin repeat protein